MRATAAGLALYALLVLARYAVQGVEGADIPVDALKAVAPGFAAGWLLRAQGLTYGAAVGSLGGLLEVGLVLFADMPLGIPEQLMLASAYTVAGAALTNALGGAAGQAISEKRA